MAARPLADALLLDCRHEFETMPTAPLRTVLRMAFTRCAKRSVLSVSAMLAAAGLMLATITVFALPPRESCRLQQHQ